MKKDKYTNICTQPWENLIISARGGCSACCGGYVIGEFSPDDDVDTIWNNERIINLRNNLLKDTPDLFCQNCVYYKIVLNSEFVNGNREYQDAYSQHPKRIELYLTEKCNLKCFMCSFTHDFPDQRNLHCVDLPLYQFYKIAKKYFPHIEALNTNCGGEFFLYENFNEYIEILSEYKPKFVNTNSNGSIKVSEENWRKVMQTHNVLCFSVDAAELILHRIIRGFDMQNVFDNINKINKIQKKEKYDFEYGFNFVIMKHNLHQMADFVTRAISEWGGKHIGFLHITGHASEKETVLKDREWRILYNIQLKKINEFRKNNRFEMTSIDYCYDENGEIEGLEGESLLIKEDELNIETEANEVEVKGKEMKKRDYINQIAENTIYNFGEKFETIRFFCFDQKYSTTDSGSILYFVDVAKDPVMAFHKKADKLHVLFHNGEEWETIITEEPCNIDFTVEIKGVGLGDIYVNGKKFTEIVDVHRISLVYGKVTDYKVHNPKYPDPEPEISKLVKDYRYKGTKK